MKKTKQILSVFLSFCMIVSCMVGISVTASASSHPVSTNYNTTYNTDGRISSINVDFQYVDSDGGVENSKNQRAFRWVFTTNGSTTGSGDNNGICTSGQQWSTIATRLGINDGIWSPEIAGSSANFTQKRRSDYPSFNFDGGFSGGGGTCTLISSSCAINDSTTLRSFVDGTTYYGLLCHSYGNGTGVFYTGVYVTVDYHATRNCSVTVTAGANTTRSGGDATQTGLTDAMTAVVYTADEGYYFPTNYSVADVNGISVTRDSYTQITVSGTPSANATIVLTAPTAKTTPDAPTTAAAVDCTTAENNDGKLTGVTTAMEYKKSDATSWTDGTGSDITGLVPGTYYIRVKATDTTNASGNQTLTIAEYVAPTTYTVTYDANGATSGTVPTDANTYANGANVTVLGNTGSLAKTNSEFLGWSKTATATAAEYVAGSTFAIGDADVTLYAVWKQTSSGGGYIPYYPFTPSAPTVTTTTTNTGSFKDLTEENTNVGKAEINMEEDKLKDAVLSEAEKAAIASGDTITVELEVKEMTPTKEEQKKIDDAVKTFEQTTGENVTVAMYFDANLFKTSNGNKTQLHELNGKIAVSFELPEQYKNTDTSVKRTFAVVRLHEGKPEVLICEYDPETNLLTFYTDKFSAYALIFEDTPFDAADNDVDADTDDDDDEGEDTDADIDDDTDDSDDFDDDDSDVDADTDDNNPGTGVSTCFAVMMIAGLAVITSRKRKNK